MAATKRSLGRGLGALIQDTSTSSAHTQAFDDNGITRIAVEKIRRNEWQPRRAFEESPLAELTESIKQRGVLQPLLVRKKGEDYELIAGERRLRAAMAAGIPDVPVIVMDAADSESLLLAMIENVQRENLNAIEEAEGYSVLAEQFNLTQEEVASRVGKSRVSVTNALRLLALPTEIKAMIVANQLSAGHAKVLLSLSNAKEQLDLAYKCLKDGLSVRALEKLVAIERQAPRKPRASRADMPASHISHLSDKLHEFFGTSIRITPCKTLANGKKTRGMIEIDFYSNDDLDRILQLLNISED
ncbi:MAG: ParB/RepB/Spo0J family partition protein [Lentisphaerae bacterium]|nr:ParB/RepB/Spo0J family partition protein [Lentisphaerota bacterium]